ncbi:hypothetical protein EIP86_005063 [Pleurotus ostreatoroseus]|nr:hypothetical protein EIP86_005063 [Pleurotus ostreatoroseus]
MDPEPGDDYIRRIAAYIRTHQQRLAAAAIPRRRRARPAHPDGAGTSLFDPFGWFAAAPDTSAAPPNVKPLVLAFDAHHLYYLLMRMEAVGLAVGSLDVKVESPARPMNYISIPGADRSDTMSLRSFASTFSAVSRLSLGGGWWGRPPPPTVDAELRYIFSSFTVLPAVALHAPEPQMIRELAQESIEHALPLETFKCLETLELQDVDPRTILGWDMLAVSLRCLTIKRSGLEDIGDVFLDAVFDDQARRQGRAVMPTRRSSFRATRLPDSVAEDDEEQTSHTEENASPSPVQEAEPPESSLHWAFLHHLSLAENSLTFVATTPLQRLTSVTHLDLSSNLLVSIPPGLSALYNLVSLNLSDNMIDSVLGIYHMLGSVLSLNLSRNRLESICGLERLLALERVDLRHNLIEESAEIGRLATLPNIAEVWVEGNPLVELEEGYRVRCFDIFWKEGKTVVLDGTQPGFYEKQYLSAQQPEQMKSTRQPSTAAAHSPPAIPVGGSPRTHPAAAAAASSSRPSPSPALSPATSTPTSQTASPALAAVGARGRKKKNKRIVELDGSSEPAGSRNASHARTASEPQHTRAAASDVKAAPARADPSPPPAAGPSTAATPAVAPRPPTKFVSRHARHQTELAPPSSSSSSPVPTSVSRAGPRASSSNAPSLRGPPPTGRPSPAHRRSLTMAAQAQGAPRRARVSPSLYEPPDRAGEGEGAQVSEAEAFRARIEALRSDMGESWLKVFNQSHMSSPAPTPRVTSSG